MGLLEPSRKGDRFGTRDAKGRLILDADAAAQLNAIRAELKRLDRFAASPPLVYSSDAAGRRWELSRPPSVYAKLTGSSSPYSWAEATRSASGVSSLVSGGRSGTAYEANSATGLGGTYATLDWTPAAGDWRFQATRDAGTGGGITNGHGCGSICGSFPASITITPQPGNGGSPWDVTTVLNFTTTGPAGAAPALFTAGENSTFCWWSDLIPRGGAGEGWYWCFNCGPYASGGAGGNGHLSLVNKFNAPSFSYGVTTHAYLFDGTLACSPLLLTGTLQSGGAGTEKWVASG
jgi:hypothetical protein